MTINNTTPSSLERFVIFQGTPDGWVLRDTQEKTDYYFLSQAGANAGSELVEGGYDLAGSPSKINAYGTLPTEETVGSW